MAETPRDENGHIYAQLLRAELLGVRSALQDRTAEEKLLRPAENLNLFRFKSEPRVSTEDAFALTPVQELAPSFASSRKLQRKIPKVPFKVLDAPQLQDEFYLNLVDWSSANVLSVGLGNCVYLWSTSTSRLKKLCDLGPDDSVTSVAWTQRGSNLAVGTNRGEVQIWDATSCRKLWTTKLDLTPS